MQKQQGKVKNRRFLCPLLPLTIDDFLIVLGKYWFIIQGMWFDN